MSRQKPPAIADSRRLYIETPLSAPSSHGGLTPSALVDRLFTELRDDPTTRTAALRILARFEEEETAAAAIAAEKASKAQPCPNCGFPPNQQEREETKDNEKS